MQPIDMRQIDQSELLISWEDGHRSLYDHRYLRLNCPCASCRDEWTGRRLIEIEEIPVEMKLNGIEPVGRYAVRFKWSDAHLTGIYSFGMLRELCPCDSCNAKTK